MADGQCIVVFDDSFGACWPMGRDEDCEGALCGMHNGKVVLFNSRADARHAIRISTAWAKLQQTIGKPHNSDFIEDRANVRIVPLVAWGYAVADRPIRIQLSRAKSWRMPPNTVKVDRSTRWGNPYKLHGDGYPMTPEVAVGCFTSLLASGGGWVMRDRLTDLSDVRRELRGKNLACWCRLDQPCHADVLLRLANEATP